MPPMNLRGLSSRFPFALLPLASLVGCGGTSSSAAAAPPGTDGGADGPHATTDGGGSDAPAANVTPIKVPDDKWTWVDFPESRCGNGKPTGIGVNPHAGATRMVIFLQGGGACFDGTTCWGASPTAVNIASGYDAASFAGEFTIDAEAFQRGAAQNPFKDAIYVFVPYCTGDVHVGTNIAQYQFNGAAKPTYHFGGKNVDLFSASLAAAFKGLDRVWLMGVSAGGFGTWLNQDFVVRAFGGIRVDLVDDSGPAIDNAGVAAAAKASWGARFPPGCSDCNTAITKTFLYDRMTYPQSRFGFLSFQTDTTLPGFYAESQQAFAAQLVTFEQSLTSDANAKSFVALTSGHVVFIPTLASSDPAAYNALFPWLTKMATDDPTWASEQN